MTIGPILLSGLNFLSAFCLVTGLKQWWTLGEANEAVVSGPPRKYLIQSHFAVYVILGIIMKLGRKVFSLRDHYDFGRKKETSDQSHIFFYRTSSFGNPCLRRLTLNIHHWVKCRAACKYHQTSTLKNLSQQNNRVTVIKIELNHVNCCRHQHDTPIYSGTPPTLPNSNLCDAQLTQRTQLVLGKKP